MGINRFLILLVALAALLLACHKIALLAVFPKPVDGGYRAIHVILASRVALLWAPLSLSSELAFSGLDL